MTVADTSPKIIYDGNGVTTEWSYSFDVIESTDIQVWLKSPAEVFSLLTTNYTVNTTTKKVKYPTAESLLDPLAAGWKIILIREVPHTQELDLQRGSTYNPETIEEEFDKLTMIIQDFSERLDRAIVAELDETASHDYLADAEAAAAEAELYASQALGYKNTTAGYVSTAETAKNAAAASAIAAAASQVSASGSAATASAAISTTQGYMNTTLGYYNGAASAANDASVSETNALASEQAAAVSAAAALVSEQAASASQLSCTSSEYYSNLYMSYASNYADTASSEAAAAAISAAASAASAITAEGWSDTAEYWAGEAEDISQSTEFAKLTGRAGGQTLQGGTGASENLTLESTAHATKGEIKSLNPLSIMAEKELRLYNSANTFYTGLKGSNATANTVWALPLADGLNNNGLATDGAGNLKFVTLITDHGNLSGLSDDDHSQYAYLQGRPTTQVFSGGNAVDATLRLQSNQAVPYTYDIEVGSRLIPYGKHATLTNQNIIYTSAEGGTNGNLLSVNINYTGVVAPCTVSMVGTELRAQVYIGTMAQDLVDACLLDAMIAKYFSFTVLNNLSMGPTGGSLYLTGGLPQVSLGKQATDQWENIWTNGISSDNVGGGGINIVTVSGPLYYSAATSLIQDATVNWTTSVLTGDASLTTYTGKITLNSAVDVDITSSAGIITLDAMGDLDFNAGGSIYLDAPTGGLSIAGATGVGFTSSGGIISFDAFAEVTFESVQSQIFMGGVEYAFSTVGTVPISLYTGAYDIGGQPPKVSIYTAAGQAGDYSIILPPAVPTVPGLPLIGDTTGEWSWFVPLDINTVPFFNSSAYMSSDVNFTYDGSTLSAPNLGAIGLTLGENGVDGAAGTITLNDGTNPGASETITYAKWNSLNDISGIVKCDGSGGFSAATDSDLSDYAKLTGRAGGQTLQGGTAASENLSLESTSHGTKGAVQAYGDFRFMGSTSGYVGFKSQVAPTSYTVSLPAAAPAIRQVLRANESDPAILEWGEAAGRVLSVVAKTSDYTITDVDGYELIEASGSGTDITLPTLADNKGRRLIVVNIDAANSIQVKREGTDPINYSTHDLTLDGFLDSVTLVAGNTSWLIVG